MGSSLEEDEEWMRWPESPGAGSTSATPSAEQGSKNRASSRMEPAVITQAPGRNRAAFYLTPWTALAEQLNPRAGDSDAWVHMFKIVVVFQIAASSDLVLAAQSREDLCQIILPTDCLSPSVSILVGTKKGSERAETVRVIASTKVIEREINQMLSIREPGPG